MASIAPLLFYPYLSTRSALYHVHAASSPVDSRFRPRRRDVSARCGLSSSSNPHNSRIHSLQHTPSPLVRLQTRYLVVRERPPYHPKRRCCPGCSRPLRERIGRAFQVNSPVGSTSLPELFDAHPWRSCILSIIIAQAALDCDPSWRRSARVRAALSEAEQDAKDLNSLSIVSFSA